MTYTIHIPLEAMGALAGLTVFFFGVWIGILIESGVIK